MAFGFPQNALLEFGQAPTRLWKSVGVKSSRKMPFVNIRWRVYHQGIPFFMLMDGWHLKVLTDSHFRDYDDFQNDIAKAAYINPVAATNKYPKMFTHFDEYSPAKPV